MKFSIQDLSSKCDQIRRFLRIWSHLLEKSWMENFIFCATIVASSRKMKNKILVYNISRYDHRITTENGSGQLDEGKAWRFGVPHL